ncbi:MAG: hypothetical protein IPN34_17195 [Planctomycetes bacterium]|nr:hypothetical protein [Planctomycetota bacterium]
MTATQDQLDLARESRLRSKARRQGLRLVKSRSRTPAHHDWSTYGLMNAQTAYVVAGSQGSGLGLSLDDVERILAE